MPRLNTDYSRTQMYRLVCKDISIIDTYVGHTTNWINRKSAHKSRCNNENDKVYNLKIYQTIRANGGWVNWDMILIEDYPCTNSLEACKRERELMEEYDAKMNTIKSYQTEEEREAQIVINSKKCYNLNKDIIFERHKKYYDLHRDELNQKKRDKRKEKKELHLKR